MNKYAVKNLVREQDHVARDHSDRFRGRQGGHFAGSEVGLWPPSGASMKIALRTEELKYIATLRGAPGEEELDVVVAYEPIYDLEDKDWYLRSEIYVNITYARWAEGTAILKGASIQTQEHPVNLGKDGKTRLILVVHQPGFYTVEVEIAGLKFEKEILVSTLK